MRYFLGADVGATKTHVLIADETGQVAGFGESGPGNPEGVGYEGLRAVLAEATHAALAAAHLSKDHIAGAGFGVAGYDWPMQREQVLTTINGLGLTAPVEAVNDALLGVLAGTSEGWGVAVVSGTGCNCWGWDKTRQRQGQVTGGGLLMGEGAGAGELMARAIQAVSHEWTRRGPATQLTPRLVEFTGARDVPDFLHGLMAGHLELPARAAPLVFEAAEAGDAVAQSVIRWAGCELGEIIKAVIRQLQFERLAFDVVMVGSLFNGGAMLIEPMRELVLAQAPEARFVRLNAPPVVGAVLLGMEQAGLAGPREALIQSTRQWLNRSNP